MSWTGEWWRRVRMLRRREELARELEEEMRLHRGMKERELRAGGVEAEEARYAASRAFGNSTALTERGRDAWGWRWLEDLGQDLRFGARMLRKNLGFAAVAVVTLALGIGANTAIFSVVNTVLLQPLPYREAGRLVTVWTYDRPKGFDTDPVSNLDFQDLKSQNHVFESMAASTDVMYTMTGAGEPAAITGYQFSPEFFEVLGVPPMLGRVFLPDENQPGKNRVVVLSHRLWMQRFGGDSGVLGKHVTLDGEQYTVVGVMPASFRYPDATELWTPLTIGAGEANDRGARYLRVMARRKPNTTLEQARTEMTTIAERLKLEYPNTNKDIGIHLIPLREVISGDIRPALLILLCAVSLVLLIACANVANLLLSRAVSRQKEIAVRRALGAGRARMVRQFLTESVLLGLAGGALGVALAYFGTNLLVKMFPPTIANLSIPRVEHIPMDAWVLGFALFVSMMTGVVFGLVPALEVSGTSPNESLKDSGRGGTGGRQGRRARNVLVISEIALSLVLLTAGGLVIKSFWNLTGGNLGFRADGVLTMRVLLPSYRYKTPTERLAFAQQVLERIAALPGVKSSGIVTYLPLSGWWGDRQVSRAGVTEDGKAASPIAVWSSVTPGYFQTMGIPLLAGRTFTGQDGANSAPAVILSAKLAQRLWPNADPVGREVNVQGEETTRRVVGIAGDIRNFGLAADKTTEDTEVYLPLEQVPSRLMCVVARSAGEPMVLTRAVQEAVWAVDKEQAVSYVMGMEQLESESLAPQRTSVMLIGGFAALALVLATIGIYGVISYSARQRTREIGIRVALGASSRDVVGLVIGEGLRLTASGLAIGVAGALVLTRFLSSMLYGVRPSDLKVFALVAGILGAVALAACYLPARRAARVDPTEALRYE